MQRYECVFGPQWQEEDPSGFDLYSSLHSLTDGLIQPYPSGGLNEPGNTFVPDILV